MSGKYYRLAVFTVNMDEGATADALYGILEEAKSTGCEVSVFNAFIDLHEGKEHQRGQLNIYRLANLSYFDGIILLLNALEGEQTYHEVLQHVKSAHVPTVSVDVLETGLASVRGDYYSATRQLAEHFVKEHQFTRIAYLAGPKSNANVQKQVQAYEDVLRENELPMQEETIVYGEKSRLRGKAEAEAFICRMHQGEQLPQAVLCSNDDIAVGFCIALQMQGIRVPEDVAVAGCGYDSQVLRLFPQMETVQFSFAEMGKQALRKCLQGIVTAGDKEACNEVMAAVPVFDANCGYPFKKKASAMEWWMQYLDWKELLDDYLIQNALMVKEFRASSSFEEMINCLKQYINLLDVKYFYYCLDSRLVSYLYLAEKSVTKNNMDIRLRSEGYAPVMSMVLAYEEGSFVTYDDFAIGNWMPWREKIQEADATFVFSPVYFEKSCCGYVAIAIGDFLWKPMLYRNWLVNINNGLQEVKNQADLRRTLRQVDRLSVLDPLTGLYNRAGFSRYTAESFRICIAEQTSAMVLFADMDGLKKINDGYGHEFGDRAIVAVAEALKASCLDSEVCARFGGDEYVVYAEDYCEADARRFCARFESALEHFNMKQSLPFSIQVSLGYQTFVPGQDAFLDKYIDRADEKMYEAKREKYKKR